jgi:hypothetical protein
MQHSNNPLTNTTNTGRERARYRRWVACQIGPRQVGGIYRNGYSSDVYEVLAIEPGPRDTWPTWRIFVRTLGTDTVRQHCTGWEDRDQVLAEPGLAADIWRAAYSQKVTAGGLAVERHALDSADRFFHQLAPGYADALALTTTNGTETLR